MEVFNVFPTTIYVGEMNHHEKYKKNFYESVDDYDDSCDYDEGDDDDDEEELGAAADDGDGDE